MNNHKKCITLLALGLFLKPTVTLAACSEYCEDLAPAIRIVKSGLIPIFQIGIPIALILLGMLDFGKAVMAGKEEEMKKSQSMFIKRCIYAVAIFFVITIVHVTFGLFKTTGTDVSGSEDWLTCYNSVEECTDSYSNGSNKVCYYCPNKSIKYLWIHKNAKSSRNCTIQEGLDQSSCLSMNPKYQPPSGSTKNDKNSTTNTADEGSSGTTNFDNKGYSEIGIYTSPTGKTYKNYKQCYNQYGNTGKASQYTWLCNQGCGLTSAAIIISSKNTSITPEYIWDNYRASKEPNGVPVSSYFTHYGMTVKSKDDEESGSSNSSFTKQELINHLKSGGAAVMRFSADPCIINGEQWTKHNHYVAVLGYRAKDDSIYISNPGDAWAKNGWYKIDNLLNSKQCKVRITHLAK